MSEAIQPQDDRTALRLIMDQVTSLLCNIRNGDPYQVLKDIREIVTFRLCEQDSVIAAEIEMLDYLIGIAQSSPTHEIWRALFAEMRSKYLTELQRDDHT